MINAFTGTDNGSAAELEHVPIPQLAVAGAIARAAHDTVEALRQRPLPKPQTAALHEQAKTAGLNIPPQIGKLFELHERFYGDQEKLKDIEKPTPGMEHLAKLREVHVALTRPEEDKLIGIGDALAAQLQALRKQLTANAEKLWAESELALLNGKTKPAESPVLFEEIRGPLPDSVAKLVPAMEASALVADWKRSIAIPQDTAQLKELRINRSGKWPNWLKEIVDEKLDRQPGSLGANPQAPVANAKSDVTPITNPDSRFEGELQISIDVTAETWTRISQVLSEEQLVLKLSALGGAMVPLTRSANGFRKGTGDLLFRYVHGDFNQASPPSPMPFELAVFSAQERKFTLWITPPKPTHAFRTVVKDGLRRQGETIRITGNEPISLCRTALDHRWNSKLVWKPETVNLPLSNEGIADLSAFLASLNEKVTKVEQRANELNEVIKGTRDPERLKAAIDDMKKYADDAGLQKPRADQEVNEAIQKAKGPDAIKWAKEEREENERLKMAIPPRPSQAKSLGAFLCYASNGNPMLNALYPIGKKLETIEPSAGPEGFAPQIQQALEVIAEKEKELQDRARFKGGRNAAEKAEARRIEDKAKSELQRVQRLKKFLSALLNLPDLRNDANNELTQVKKERMMLDKHPMRESGKLPPGDFELQVQPAPDAPWLTLVLFKNP